jgi:hypothetical protein
VKVFTEQMVRVLTANRDFLSGKESSKSMYLYTLTHYAFP